MPDDLFKAAERAAKRLRISRSQLYQLALGTFLERHNDLSVTDALNEVYAQDPSISQVDPVLQQMQTATLKPEEW